MKTLATITTILSLALVGCTETSDYDEPIPEQEEPAPAPAPEPEPEPEPVPADDPEPEDDGGLLACSFDEIEPIISCALDNCLEIDPATIDPTNPELPEIDLTGLMTCAVANCSSEVLGLSSSCQSCIFNGVADGGTDALLEHCANFDDLLPGGLPGGGGGGGFPLP